MNSHSHYTATSELATYLYRDLAQALAKRLKQETYTFDKEDRIKGRIPIYLIQLQESIKKVKGSDLPQSILNPVKADFFMELIQHHISWMDEVERLTLTGAIIAMNNLLNKPEICRHLADSFGKAGGLKYAAFLSNCSYLQFAIAIAKIFGISSEYCFHTFPEGSNKNVSNYIYFPHLFNTFESGNEAFKLTGTIKQLGFNGHNRQDVHRYSSNSDKNIFPITVSLPNSEMNRSIGTLAPVNLLCNIQEIVNNPHASILFVPSPDQLFSMLEYSDEVKMLERCSVVVTGIFGGKESLKGFKYQQFHTRKVIVVCSPDCEEYGEIKNIINGCQANGVKELRIVPYPIIAEHCNLPEQNISQKLARELKQNAIDLSSFERVKFLIRRIDDLALSVREWEMWETKFHLRKESGNTKETDIPMFYSQPWDYGLKDAKRYDYTLESLFDASSISMFYGATGSCKSTLALGLALALCRGMPFMGIKGEIKRKVVYVDGELKNRISQIISNLMPRNDLEVKSDIYKNFSVITPEKVSNITTNQTQFLSYIEKHRAEVVFFDNLLTIFPDAPNGQNSSWFRVANELNKLGVHPIFINHTCKDGKEYLGGSSLKSLSQNFFRIDRLKIEDLANLELCLPVDISTMYENGRFIRATLEKTKVAPRWDGKSIFMYLPIDGTWEQLTNWPDIQESAQVGVISPTSSDNGCSELTHDVTYKLEELSPDERKAYDFIVSRPNGIQRQQLEGVVGCKEGKALKVLKSLCEKGLIVNLGEGKALYYKAKLFVA